MDNQPKKKRNKWLALINIPIQMGVIIYLFSVLGTWLDSKYGYTSKPFVKIATLVGVAIAFYNINRQLKDINASDD
ncbi:AtpZ/AtpI family protein [Flavobacterium sp. SUN046]|uniref:AtpZ/AtpI family protein n=1 Tax=Flavobacterium sp. SUN046 TaxID=3002440 RepID=UPI002DBC93F8|nr:AtpZ/AtpI family protein [Flavobacterium sp. SUN046]MEC4048232.1 AtpZ/AtpI family protein [Flavobacterium sp. SUN046]